VKSTAAGVVDVLVEVVVVDVLVELVVVDVVPDFFADLASVLAGFASDVVVVFGPCVFGPCVFGVPDFAVMVAFGALDPVVVGAFEDVTLIGADPFPLGAASIGASVRERATIAVPNVIRVMRMVEPRRSQVQSRCPVTASGGGRKAFFFNMLCDDNPVFEICSPHRNTKL
jgi:hypothetical protein